MPGEIVGTIDIPDAEVEQFRHLPPYHKRFPGRLWRFLKVRVPLSELHCAYDHPGNADAPPNGLMAAAGSHAPDERVGWRGTRIADMAWCIGSAEANGTLDSDNASMAKVLRFRECGRNFIMTRPEPLAWVYVQDRWWVREGTHRTIALCLLGEHDAEAIMMGYHPIA